MYFFTIISFTVLLFGLINPVKAQDFNKNLNVQAFDYYLMWSAVHQNYQSFLRFYASFWSRACAYLLQELLPELARQ